MKASAKLNHGFSNPVGRDSCEIRQATAADAPRVAALFRTCFGFDQAPAYFRTKYFQTLAGTSVSMVAELDGQIVGHYGLCGVPIRLGHELVAGAQSVDTMTHPDHRNRGILVQLATRAMEIAATRGVDVLYGFPNRQSYPASIRRLNWHHVRDVPVLSRPLRSDGLRRVPRSLRGATALALRVWPRAATRGYEVERRRPHNGVIAALLRHRSAADDVCQTERFAEWYDWRFAAALGREYRWIVITRAGAPAAFAVWQNNRAEQSAAIAELVGVDDDARAAMVSAVMAHALEDDCAAITTLTTRPEILRALRTNGFRRSGVLPLKVRPLTARVLGANIHEGDAWQVLGADCDVF